MVQSIDLIDKKLIKELDENCRRPLSQIAKKLRISQPRLLYRIKKLNEEKILPFYYTLINAASLGYTFYRVMIRFKSTTPKKEQEIIEQLKSNPNTFWVVSCSGKFDLIIDFFARDIKEFDEIIQEFLKTNFEFISQKEIATVVKSWQFSRTFFLQNIKSLEFKGSYGHNSERIAVDNTDKKILKILAENPMISNTDIAQKIKIDRNTVKNRIKGMIEKEIITGFRAWFEVPTAGYKSYKLIIRLNNVKPDIENKLLLFARLNKDIIYFNKILGDWDYEYDIEVETEKEFYDLLSEIKNRFSDSIKDFEIISIIKNYKLDYLPPI